MPTGPKIVREVPPEKQDPALRFRKAKEEGMVSDEWGVGDGGYKIPKTPGERMRKNVPYKVSSTMFYETIMELKICAVQIPQKLGRFLGFRWHAYFFFRRGLHVAVDTFCIGYLSE